MIYKTYKIYGRDPRTKKQPRYLFSISTRNQGEAIANARRRVKGAYTIVRATRQR